MSLAVSNDTGNNSTSSNLHLFKLGVLGPAGLDEKPEGLNTDFLGAFLALTPDGVSLADGAEMLACRRFWNSSSDTKSTSRSLWAPLTNCSHLMYYFQSWTNFTVYLINSRSEVYRISTESMMLFLLRYEAYAKRLYEKPAPFKPGLAISPDYLISFIRESSSVKKF